MLQKLKNKAIKTFGNKKLLGMPFLGIFFLFLAFGVFYPNPASLRAALCKTNGTGFTEENGQQVPKTLGYQTCRIDEISVKTDIYPGNQETKPNNYMRVGKNSSLTISMRIALENPDVLTFNSDELDFNSSDDKEISGMSFGVLEKSQNASKCSTESKATGYVPLLGNSTYYLFCDFGSGFTTKKNKQATKVSKNELLYRNTLTVSSSDLSKLGMTEVGKRYELYLYPMIWYDGVFKDSPVVLNQAGKSMYVELYETQTAADNANVQLGDHPTDIPEYGANIGGASTGTEQSNAVMKIIEWVIGFLLGILQELIYVLFYFFVAPLIQGMLSIRTYTDTFVAVIYPGWEIVRNLCNIIFIVALIAIAMGTLLRVEAYKSKQVLVQLIMAALLVNFSLVIAQAILGVADTIQNQFLPNNVEVIRSLGKDLMVSYRSIIYGNDSLSGNFAGIIRHIIFVILSAGSLAVFMALAAFLFIRIVMLWVLLMISPIAYAAGALPSTSHYRQEWWQNFIKYAFFTPIMAFFINLTAIIATQQKTNPILQAVGVNTAEFGNSSFAKMVFQVGGNLLMLVFLVVGMKVAEQFSIMGASKLTSFAQKGMYAPLGLAKVGGGYVGRKWNEATSKIIGHDQKMSGWRAAAFAVANPVAFAKGFKKQTEERVHRAQAKAEATGLQVAEQKFSTLNPFSKESIFRGGSYKLNPHVLQHEKEEEDEQAKKLQNLSREEVARRAAQIFKMGDTEEDMAYKRGVIKLAMSKGYIDDIVQEAHKNQEGRDMIKEMMKIKGKNGQPLLKEGRDFKKVKIKDENGNEIETYAMEYNHATRRAMYMSMFGVDDHGHLKDHAAMRLITQEGEKEGMDTGHLEYMTDMRFNEKTGHFEWYELDEEHAEKTGEWLSQGDVDMAGKEIAKRDSRTQARIAWHSLLSSDGQSFSKAIFLRVSKAIAENPGFMQERQANKLLTGHTDGEVVDRNIELLRTSDTMEIDENFANVIGKMADADEKATATLIQRFLNDTGKEAVDKRLKKGVKINVVKKNEQTGENEIIGQRVITFEQSLKELSTKDNAVKAKETEAKDTEKLRHEALLEAIKGLAGTRNAPPASDSTVLYGPDNKPIS